MGYLEPPCAAILGLKGLALTSAEKKLFADKNPLGFILFSRNVETPEQVKALITDLRSAVGRDDPLILIDQEGGRVQRLSPPHWRHAPPMRVFGDLYASSPDIAVDALRRNMRLIGVELASLGITVDCAPVLDVPVPGAHDVIGDRASSENPNAVAALGAAACYGLLDAGVIPVIKHLPGHGRAKADSHTELPVVNASIEDLRTSDFVPFLANLPHCYAMTAHVLYLAIDPDLPATVSRKVISEVIRGEIGFNGLLMSDDLGMSALKGSLRERAEMALSAGCDAVMHCEGDFAAMVEVLSAVPPVGNRCLEALRTSAEYSERKLEDGGQLSELAWLDDVLAGFIS